jgi:hypothetical protein
VYHESTFLASLVELQMEFYIKVLQILVKPRHVFFNILGGKKAMHTRHVRLNSLILLFKLFMLISTIEYNSYLLVDKIPTLIIGIVIVGGLMNSSYA